jgi:hypothetical protein
MYAWARIDTAAVSMPLDTDFVTIAGLATLSWHDVRSKVIAQAAKELPVASLLLGSKRIPLFYASTAETLKQTKQGKR